MRLNKKGLAGFLTAFLLCASLPVGAAQVSAAEEDYRTTWNDVTYSHNPSVAEGKSIIPGIDVSVWQGEINWEEVASSGIRFALIREAYTEFTSFDQKMDENYEANMQGAAEAGIPHGIYYRSQAITVDEAIAEANYCVSHLGPYGFELPIMMDYEVGDNTGRMTSSYPDADTQTEIINAFCETIEAAGYRCMLYSNADQATYSFHMSDIPQKYQLWLARYTTEIPGYDGTYVFWQCGQTNVNGIAGIVDLDWWYVNPTDIVKSSSGEWIYTVEGTPDPTYTGLAANSEGTWFVRYGRVQKSYTGLVTDSEGTWYVADGKVQDGYTGNVTFYKRNYNITNGKLEE